jgi:predicted phosphohydrolase
MTRSTQATRTIPAGRDRRVAVALRVLLVCVVASGCVGSSAPASAPIAIGIIGDQTGAADLNRSYGVLQQGVDALKFAGVDVVLHTGDLVESTEAEAAIAARFQQATALLNQLPAPWFLTVGDHDVNPPTFQQNSPDRAREDLFKRLYGAINPKVTQELWYSTDVKGYHIVVLDSLEALHTDPRWGNVFYAQISDRQLRWLEADLAHSATNTRGVIVLLHHPLWYNAAGWSRVHALLARHAVKAVIAGHFHYNQTEEPIDGIAYIVVGATGADIKQADEASGGLHHVSVLEIDGGGVRLRLLPLAGHSRTAPTPRPAMDRVQALDVVLGNLWSFETDNPVFLKAGRAIRSCASDDRAQLAVKNIGNAIDLPVTTTIDLGNGPAVTLVGQSFGANLCQTLEGPLQCRLAPSAGVSVSNTSVVELSPPPPPLWTATISAVSPSLAVGTPITLRLDMSFALGNETYAVSKSATTTIKACP